MVEYLPEVESEAGVEVPVEAVAEQAGGVGEQDDAREASAQEVGAEQVQL